MGKRWQLVTVKLKSWISEKKDSPEEGTCSLNLLSDWGNGYLYLRLKVVVFSTDNKGY